MILVKGSSLRRCEAKDFGIDIVSLIRGLGIPAGWILGVLVDGYDCQRSPIDVLKQLVYQILQASPSLLNAQSPALNGARFQTATTEQQWFDFLGSVLVGLPQLYIVVDAAGICQELSSEVSWPEAFLKLMGDLSKVCPGIAVKIVLVGYGATPFIETSLPDQLQESTIHINGDRRHMGLMRKKQRVREYGKGPRRQLSNLLRPFIFRTEGT